ncbi:hypothetical protein DPMN_188643 [Dreissena polymorpha]|uniref:Uncharacterized protein n=1 Tax=Dreissena polymorpha TaxID=45954 RepID=A0A9D4I8Q1_DREPO|nr:hypothetical protein DPMN_188643 [Dreissena polymorpha]
MKDALIKLQASLRGDTDICASLQDELKQLGDAIHDIIDTSKLELLFVASIKCQEQIEQSETYKKKNFDKIRSSIAFQPYSDIEHYLSKLSGLGTIEHGVQTLTAQGNQDRVIRLNGKSEYDVSIPSDSHKCFITALCVLPDRLVLVADNSNTKIKLLDEQCRVVNHSDVSAWPHDICQIAPSEFVVTVEDLENTHEVLFITVINNQVVIGRKLKLQHNCVGHSYHQENLFVLSHCVVERSFVETSGTVLYKYTMSGNVVCKLYEDESDTTTGKSHGRFILI